MTSSVPFLLNVGAIKAKLGVDKRIGDSIAFGLGEGAFFECFRREKSSPSRFFIGYNRKLEINLAGRAEAFLRGDRMSAVLSALGGNALAMNVDRSPVAGVMGMELFAEELENWSELPDSGVCARRAASTISATGSLYRRWLLEFVQVAAEWLNPAAGLVITLEEIAAEWDGLRQTLESPGSEAGTDFAAAGRALQRLAAREEHFWGQVLDITGE